MDFFDYKYIFIVEGYLFYIGKRNKVARESQPYSSPHNQVNGGRQMKENTNYPNSLEQVQELLKKHNKEAYIKRLAKIGVIVRDKNDN